MMDQQKRRGWLLIFGFFMIVLAIMQLVFVFWAFFDGEKLNKAGIAGACSSITIAVVLFSLSLLKHGPKGPTPPDPK